MHEIHPSHKTEPILSPDGKAEVFTCTLCGARSITNLHRECTNERAPVLQESGALALHILFLNDKGYRGVKSDFRVLPCGTLWAGVQHADGTWTSIYTPRRPEVRNAFRDSAKVEGTTTDGQRFHFRTVFIREPEAEA